jgi:hypothetical protein
MMRGPLPEEEFNAVFSRVPRLTAACISTTVPSYR